MDIPEETTLFKGSDELPGEVKELQSPYSFFRFLLTNEITNITEQTNIYSAQEKSEKPANVTEDEINVFIGICIYMSILHLPSTRSYWNNSLDIPAVSQVMTCNRFEEIKRFLHFNNNMEQL